MVAVFSWRVGKMNLWGPKEKKIRSDPFQSVVSGTWSLRDLRILFLWGNSFNSCCFYLFFSSRWTSCHELLVEFTPSWLQLVRCSNTCIGPCVRSLKHIVELLHSATLNDTFVQFPKPNTMNFNMFRICSLDFFACPKPNEFVSVFEATIGFCVLKISSSLRTCHLMT